MPIPSIVATIMTAALTMTSAGGGIGAQTPVATTKTVASTPAHAGHPAESSRPIEVMMDDRTFSPDWIDVRVGETVTFVFSNLGYEVHDAFVGDTAAQEQHEREMRTERNGHDHAHEGGVTVLPGQSGTLRYTFDKAGLLEIGCHQPGHYKAGMIAFLDVKA